MAGRAPHALVEVPGRREQLVQVPVPGHRHLGPLARVDDQPQVFFYIIAGERFPLEIPDFPRGDRPGVDVDLRTVILA